MGYSSADRQRVFLASRTVFTGPQAQIRKPKLIRDVMEQHRESFQSLIKDFGFDKVVEVTKVLLNQRVFESDLQARITFPELFRPSQTRDIQRATSEDNAAGSVAKALEELASTSESGEAGNEQENDDNQKSNVELEPAGEISPSLYPSYLPYRTQHLIFTTAQRQLEDCCFAYAVKWLPTLLEQHEWDCAEAVELTKWTKFLAKHCSKLPASALCNNFKVPLEKIFFSTDVLRHTAVHRLSTTVRVTHEMIRSATRLAQTLGDHERAADLENLELEIGSRIKDMELNKNFLENRLDEQLKAISEQRAELDRKEREATARMIQDGQEHKILIGGFLEDAVKTIFHRREPPDYVESETPGESESIDIIDSPEGVRITRTSVEVGPGEVSNCQQIDPFLSTNGITL